MEITGDVGLAALDATADYPGTGDFLFRLAFDEEYHIVLGGTNELAQGIARLLARQGARILTSTPVERIVVRDGRAQGVRLANGETLEARAVVSGANFANTMLDLVGEEHLDPRFVERVKGLRPSRGGKFDVHLAVSIPPRYRAPEAREALCLFLGYEGLGDIETRWSEIQAGTFPVRPSFHCGCTSIYDPDSVPDGGHTLYLWQFVPAAVSRGTNEETAPGYLERILARWREYTADLGDAQILGRYGYYLANWKTKQAHPYGGVPLSHGQHYDRRPLPECADYRTPVPGLYLCGSASHPGGSVRFGPARNAAQVIAKDLGLKPWWNENLVPGTPLVSRPDGATRV
jgi:phytoene dehydrogenase-like protein